MKKILLLAYYYPPAGGAGVQRTVKFVKYLPGFGYTPITVAGTGRKSIFPDDQELSQEVSPFKRYDISFSHTFAMLDNMLKSPLGRWTNTGMSMWLRASEKLIDTVIQKEKPDLLFVTTSPFPATKVIEKLSRKYKIPWVLDMRDPWALDPITQYPTILHYYISKREMQIACNQADAVIMNTLGALNAARDTFHEIKKEKFYCIPNGWDQEDFAIETSSTAHYSPLKIVHTGLFHTKLATTSNCNHSLKALLRFSLARINLLTRSPHYLFAAYRKLINDKKIPADSIQFIFAGAATSEDVALAQQYQIEGQVKFTGYLTHKDSVSLLAEGDVLFLPLHELGNFIDTLIVPGKTYEYIAAGKPILACVSPGDAREIVVKSGLGYVCEPSDVDSIANTLLILLEQHNSDQGISVQPDVNFIRKFERKYLTRKLASIFDSLLHPTANRVFLSTTKAHTNY